MQLDDILKIINAFNTISQSLLILHTSDFTFALSVQALRDVLISVVTPKWLPPNYPQVGITNKLKLP